MSASLEKWLARPTTSTSLTTSEVKFSFPVLSSSTTDWLKQPISSTPSISMTTSHFSAEPKQSQTTHTTHGYPENFQIPASVQGIQQWLKTVEPFEEIEEDDFELLDESSNPADDIPTSNDFKDHHDFELPLLQSETPCQTTTDLDIWLTKEGSQSLQSTGSDFTTIFDTENNSPFTFKDRQIYPEKDDGVKDQPGEKVIRKPPKHVSFSSETEIWIISQDKNLEPTTITECRMFRNLKHESDNLMKWVKKEAGGKQDECHPAENPLAVWINFQKSTDWLKQSGVIAMEDKTKTEDPVISRQDTNTWLLIPDKGNSIHNTQVGNENPLPLFPPMKSDNNKWLKNDTQESLKANPEVNWNQLLMSSNEDSFEKWLKPKAGATDTKETSEDDTVQRWLHVKPEVKSFEVKTDAVNNEHNQWLFKGDPIKESPASLTEYAVDRNKWLVY